MAACIEGIYNKLNKIIIERAVSKKGSLFLFPYFALSIYRWYNISSVSYSHQTRIADFRFLHFTFDQSPLQTLFLLLFNYRTPSML